MCVVSMIGDHYNDKWRDRRFEQPFGTVNRFEFEELKKEVQEMKVLKRAKIYDEENNEPDCEIEEKMEFLRKVAKFVGIDLDDVIGSGNE